MRTSNPAPRSVWYAANPSVAESTSAYHCAFETASGGSGAHHASAPVSSRAMLASARTAAATSTSVLNHEKLKRTAP